MGRSNIGSVATAQWAGALSLGLVASGCAVDRPTSATVGEDVGSAQQALVAAPTGLTPVDGSTVSTSQVFGWTAVSGATQYEFWINDVWLQTYSATSLGCAGGGTCNTPAITLPAGTSNTWYVEAQESTGNRNMVSRTVLHRGWSTSPVRANCPCPTGRIYR